MAVVSKLPATVVPRLRSLSTLVLSEKLSVQPQQPSSLDLDGSSRIFSSVPTSSLVRSLGVLSTMAVGPFVDAGIAVMKSQAVMGNVISRAVVLEAVRRSVFRHFCAGESGEEVGKTVRDMWEKKGLRGILDYGLEDAVDGFSCDRNLDGFLRTVELAASLPTTSASMCIKITALCPHQLLEKISNLLRWEHKEPSFNLSWKTHSFPILSSSSMLYHSNSMPDPLTEADEHELQLTNQRLTKIFQRCQEVNIPVLVDAEYLSVQPAIDYFTYSMAMKFNRGAQPIVFGTIQAYLRDARERLVKAVEAAEQEGFCLGVKLVRGAYMSRENQFASSVGLPSPIHSSLQETHNCYNSCASYMLESLRKGQGSVVLATHNNESGKFAVTKAEELGIDKENQKLQFAQLMGMAEGLSLGLRNAGYQVSKYLPFGPVEQVMPYLLRRAEENRGMLSTASVDRKLIRKELLNRLIGSPGGMA